MILLEDVTARNLISCAVSRKKKRRRVVNELDKVEAVKLQVSPIGTSLPGDSNVRQRQQANNNFNALSITLFVP